ncbi:hypothetical protein H5410_028098 [Solanum commersonii]|uniref:Uncharacterized protein n=1 Tax=Solanum commersonii TaxID=4109 RepID=A0A9J5Z6H3_SOLCO|nr:hypothetical protein H5410_028098 [Solanum commersonii]
MKSRGSGVSGNRIDKGIISLSPPIHRGGKKQTKCSSETTESQEAVLVVHAEDHCFAVEWERGGTGQWRGEQSG